MKDAKSYEKKVKKLLSDMKKPKAAPGKADPVEMLVLASLEENASPVLAGRAMAIFTKEFVDLNELRVAQPKELVELMDKNYPHARQTAEQIAHGLRKVFYDVNDLSMAHMATMTKRDLRRKLSELELSPYVAAALVLFAFDGHAIPVDRDLAETLAMDGYVAEDSDIADVQGFLERIVTQKNAVAAHEFFRGYIAKRADALAKKRKADEQVRLAAERKAAEQAEAKARAEAEKKAAADARTEAKAAKAAEAAKKRKKMAAARSKTGKTPVKKKAVKEASAKAKKSAVRSKKKRSKM